jgi:hypothetical protein
MYIRFCVEYNICDMKVKNTLDILSIAHTSVFSGDTKFVSKIDSKFCVTFYVSLVRVPRIWYGQSVYWKVCPCPVRTKPKTSKSPYIP